MRHEQLSIPYMGSKKKIAGKIIDFIVTENKGVKYIYDLFGGGGAITFEAMQRPEIDKVFYNELNTGICNLLQDIKINGVRDEYFEWVDRETFHEYKNMNCWKAGLIKSCWSFGNDQKSYLFSQENELIKKPLHNIIVNKCKKSVEEFKEISGLFIPDNVIEGNSFLEESIHQRRIRVMRFVKDNIGRFDMQSLERLESLESLERLERLEITNLSYEKVKIETLINETIVYLDPPYKSTSKYQLCIDHDELLEYVKSSQYKIYISSYEFDLPCVLEIDHRTTLSATSNKKVVERLFCNK